jgi:hypothetical protein
MTGAWVARQQGLDGSLRGASPHDILCRTGWVRSVGGASPYLAIAARGGWSRAEIDAAVAAADIHELPSARGCTYVVPRTDYAVALRAAQGTSDAQEMATARKFGVTDAEVDKLASQVLLSLEGGPKDPAELKKSLGEHVRTLPPEAKKKGLTTTLPLALGWLQPRGFIRRIPVNGRLDQQRYRYALWSGPRLDLTMTDGECHLELARRFYRWAGPATIDQLAWWGGMTKTAAKAATAAAGVAEMDGAFLFPEDRDAMASAKPPPPGVYFLGGLDNVAHPKRGVAHLLDPEDAEAKVWTEKGSRPVSTVFDMEHHLIVESGRLIGVWEWDGVRGELAWATFRAPSSDVRAEARRFQSWVAENLGDVRSFSLDSPASRGDRVAAVRAMPHPGSG